MDENKRIIEVLNDLIKINNDRIAGYEKAVHEEREIEPDIRDVFYRFSTESRSFVNDLHAIVLRLGGAPVGGSTIPGKIYLFWLDMKARFTGHDTYEILAVCEQGEEAVQKAYDKALESSTELPFAIGTLVENQRNALKRSHDLLEKYRKEHANLK